MGKHLLKYQTKKEYDEKEVITEPTEFYCSESYIHLTSGITVEEDGSYTLVLDLDGEGEETINLSKETGYFVVDFGGETPTCEEIFIGDKTIVHFYDSKVEWDAVDSGYTLTTKNGQVYGYAPEYQITEGQSYFQIYTGTTDRAVYCPGAQGFMYEILTDSKYLDGTVNSVFPGVSYTLENEQVCYNPIIKYLTATYLVESAGTMHIFNPSGTNIEYYQNYGGYDGTQQSSMPGRSENNGNDLVLGESEISEYSENDSNTPPAIPYKVISMEVDGVEVPVVSEYEFSTTGTHVIKYGIAMNKKEIPTGFFTDAHYQCEGSWCSVYFNQMNVIKVEIPDTGFNSIGDYCFNYCLLTCGVTMPNSIKKIGDYAFQNTHMEVPFTFPTSLKHLGKYCFSYANLIDIPAFPEAIRKIPDGCFNGAQFVNLEQTLPRTVNEVGDGVFYYSNLTAITVPGNIKKIGNQFITGCYNLVSVSFENGIKKIGYGFAKYTRLTNITFPDSLEEIGYVSEKTSSTSNLANFPSTLTSVTFGNNLKKLGAACFESCNALSGINSTIGTLSFPSGIKYIGDECFKYCNALQNLTTSITLPDSIEYIGASCFQSFKSITSLTLPSNLAEIKTYVFGNCSSLTSVTLNNGLTRIGYRAFQFTPLTGITIPNSVTEIASRAFISCSALTNASLPSSLTKLGYRLANETGSSEEVDGAVFIGCNSLTSITVPSQITEVKWGMFSGCTSLASINFLGTITKVEPLAFEGCPWLTNGGCPTYGNIYYPCETVAYKVVSTAVSSVTLKETTTEISNACFKGSQITAITIPSSVKTIGDSAFSNSSIVVASIPTTVENIGRGLYYGSASLTAATIPGSLSGDIRISAREMFRGCSNLKTCTIENGVTTFPDNCFWECTNLTSVTIPSTITASNGYPFVACVSLSAFGGDCPLISNDRRLLLNRSNGEAIIGAATYGLTEYTIPENITEITAFTFTSAATLTGVSFLGYTNIGNYAFENASRLKSLTFYTTTNPTGNCYRAFNGVATGGTIYCPAGASSNYTKWITGSPTYYYVRGKNWTIQEMS